MALTLSINNVKFNKYIVPTTQLILDDPLNLSKQLNFSVYPADTSFPIVTAKQRVRLFDETRVWFTGYVSSTPRKANIINGFAGYNVVVLSDESAFANQTFSQSITYLGLNAGVVLQNILALTNTTDIDISQVPSGPIVPQFTVNSGQTFVQAAQALTQKVGWRWWIIDSVLHFSPQNDKPYGYDILSADPTFIATNLSIIRSNVPVVNDIFGRGVPEPTSYVKDNYIGDGISTTFNLFTNPFGLNSEQILFNDPFNSGNLNVANWTLTDPSQSVSYASKNVTTTLSNASIGSTILYAKNPFELGGEITFDLGTFTFNNLSNGILGGVYTDTTFTSASCFAGVWATGNTIRTGLQAFINGQVQPTTVATQVNHSYKLLVHVSSDTLYRFHDIYRSINGQFGGDIIKSDGYVTVEIQDQDLSNPTLPPTTTTLFDTRILKIPAFGVVGLFNCLSLFATVINGVTVTQHDPIRVRTTTRISNFAINQNGTNWNVSLKDTPALSTTILAHYRASGNIQSRITNSTNITNNGAQAVTITLPSSVRSTADCENLFQAYLLDHASSLFEGSYVANGLSLKEIPTSGRYVNLSIPSVSNQPFVSIVRETKITITDLTNMSASIITTFGFAPLMSAYSTANIAGTITSSDINSLPLFLEDDADFLATSISGGLINADGGKTPSGNFQVRSSDVKWGIDTSDLISTSGTQTFSITRISRADVFYVREVNGTKFSRNSSIILASGYPIIPTAPTVASSITVGLNIAFNVVLGSLADVDSVFVDAPDNTHFFSQKIDPVALALLTTPQILFTKANIDYQGVVNQRNYSSYHVYTTNFRGEKSNILLLSGSLPVPLAPTITVGTINGEVVSFALSTETRTDITQEILEVASDSGFVTIVATDSENAQFGSSTVDAPTTGTYFVRARKADILGFGANTASPPSFVVTTVSTVDKNTPNPPTTILAPTQAIVKSADGTLAENVTLTWAAPVTIPPAVTGYLIRYKVSTATIYTYNRVGNVTTATLHGLLLNTTYNISVASMGEVSQQSTFPTDINVTTNNNAVAPSAVSGLSAIGAFREVNLKWTAITDSDLAFYQVEWASDVAGSPGAFQTIARANTNSYLDKGDSIRGQLAVSTTYWYRVSAFNTTANQGTLSSNVSALTTPVAIDTDVADGSNFGRVPISIKATGSPSSRVTGFQIVSNPDFQNGLTNWNVYDNNTSGKVTHTLITDTTAPSGFGQKLQISTAAGSPVPSPGLGGFFYGTSLDGGTVAMDKYHAGDTYIVTVVANIPVGYSINFANNSLGTGGPSAGSTTWLTTQAGTGNWQNYMIRVVLGTSGISAFAFPFFYLTGTAPVTWFVGYLNAVDVDQPHRFTVLSVDPNQRPHIDFTQGPHVGKQLDNIGDGSTFKRLLNINSDNTIHISTSLNPQGSVLPNQAVLITFNLPTANMIIPTWGQQSLLRPDGSTETLLSSSGSTLLTNGDMESGTVGSQETSWTNVGGAPSFSLITVNTNVHGGTKAGNINNTTGATSINQTPSISLTGGLIYVVEGWVKTDALPSVAGQLGGAIQVAINTGITSFTIYTKFGAFDAGNTTTPVIALPADGVARGYTFLQCFFSPTATGTVNVNLINQSSSGNVWFDDIKLYPYQGTIFSPLVASTTYYLYPYIDLTINLLRFSNGNPPTTTPSDTFSLQASNDGRQAFALKKITMPAAGTTNSTDTGGGSGTCPEASELVFLRRYSDNGELIFEGQLKAMEVRHGFESDDGTFRTGDFLKGFNFKKQQEVYRAVQHYNHVPCAGWMIVDGHRVTPCETVFYEGVWMPAWKVPGATHENYISNKILIQVEADWEDEHNYYVGNLLIHNSIVFPC